MRENWEKARLALQQPLSFGWREGTGPVRMAWPQLLASGGAFEASGPFSFRAKFYQPANPKYPQDLWKDFTQGLGFVPECFFSGELPELPAPAFFPLPLPQDLQTEEEWKELCTHIEGALALGSVQKVVPARSAYHQLSPAKSAKLREDLLTRLFAKPAEGSFRFFVHQGKSTFFGASPEVLFRRQGGKILVPAIAGTRQQASGAEAELFENRKERAEHAFVVEGIVASLKALGLEPKVPAEPSILRARNLVHLHTPIEAEDNSEISSGSLVEALHPTAAVGGTPSKEALELLHAYEPWERGLFSSPLLFTSKEGETCIVGIRSGLLRSEGLYLFAGAGYVKGSDWKSEWEETARKMDSLRSLVKEGL
jgi:menaquinone-specific isochorismate synthase